jgi:hypothetical protein
MAISRFAPKKGDHLRTVVRHSGSWLDPLLGARKNKRLKEAQDEPNGQKRETFQRKAFELEEELRDQECNSETDSLLFESYLNA